MEQENTIKVDVAVHKAGLPLADGESLGHYSAALRKAASEALMKKLNLTPKTASAYMLEVFASNVVFDVCKREGGPDGPMSEYKYYMLSYTRKDNGAFDFANVMEVERVTSFRPKESLPTAKASTEKTCEGGKVSKDCGCAKGLKGCASGAKKVDKQLEPGWVPAEKAFWNGVV